MENVVVTVIEIDDIRGWHSTLKEGNVIVFDWTLPGIKVRLIPSVLGGGVDEIEQPRFAVCVAIDVEVGIADHIHHEQGFDLFQRAVLLPSFGEMARAIDTVAIGPTLHRFFPVGPNQPYAIAIALFAVHRLAF